METPPPAVTSHAATPAQIKELHTRMASAIGRRPILGRGWGRARAHLGNGFACSVDEQGRRIDVDQPEAEGGGGAAPHPEQLMRASLGACLAMGYRAWGARMDVAIDWVTVEVTCQYDTRGQLGLSDQVPVGWQFVLFDVTIASDAPEADIRQVVTTADRLNPMLANLAATVPRTHRLTLLRRATT